YGWFGVELLGAGMLAMALGFGLVWPRLDWDNPRQMNSGLATLASFASEAVLGLLGGGLLCLPVLAQVLTPDWAPAAWLLGIAGPAAALPDARTTYVAPPPGPAMPPPVGSSYPAPGRGPGYPGPWTGPRGQRGMWIPLTLIIIGLLALTGGFHFVFGAAIPLA